MQYNFDLFKKYPNLFIAFSEKKDGSMKIPGDNPGLLEANLKNREIFFKKFGLDSKMVANGELVHGENIGLITKENAGERISGADGLVSREKKVFLSFTAADCLPIFLFDPKTEIVGIVHAGWRSLEKGILSNAIKIIKDLGGTPENILTGIGPAICQKHYEVGQEMAEKFAKYPEVIKKDGNKIFLDIKKTARLQLLETGIREKNIEISPECTFEMPKKYFSARRDNPAEIEAMVAVIGMKK